MSVRSALVLASLLTFCLIMLQLASPCSGRVLKCCDAAQELDRAGISKTFKRTFVCLMNHESKFNTAKKSGPGHKASYAYGILQIRSDKYCNAFRPGPSSVCQKKCDDFLDDNIQDDLACAKLILEKEGFKYWNSFARCKDQSVLPNLATCNNNRAGLVARVFGRPMSCR